MSVIRSYSDFDKKLISAGSKLVVVDFYATWCGPCKQMDPVVKSLAKKYTGDVVFLKVDVDKYDDISRYYKVSSMPTFVFIRNTKKISSFTGADSAKLTNRVAKLA